MQSCVTEAQQLARTGFVHAMHDATEGGFVAALNELAEASAVGFKVDWDRIPVSKELLTLKAYFGLSDWQLLSLSSTGTIIGAVDPNAQEDVKAVLSKNGLSACFLGVFTEKKKRLLIKNRQEEAFPKVTKDPYDLILAGT